ncbi:glycosyltransferase family 2 protein [Aequorivita viscosa]|uniref:Glycosyltransferase involved in cell wall bisynthesis n=1 Tax=Aequorivita viscosa TaxID=797419 RepID=A0A1M6AYA3_9FLAO|nr:glycosyltransferase family A protein [Aequorivita viscosa]SDW31198.1 Glycosyltransferase involved in cell wall bisynthesis [Aequorivita viscosa]SHI41298.1 Glycosyltransferase involved in cell wall bisynthesis [Aequorivita viscosa]
MPKFSVIIPLYNKEKDIEKTMASLFAQRFSDFEVIIVNDGSTDQSERVIKSLTDSRIKLFNKKNEGVALTRNFAVKQATSKHIAFLDADDYWHPHHLENLNNLIEKLPEAQWYATAYEKKHNQKLITSMISPILEKKGWSGIVDDYFKNSLIDALAWTSAVCMKKSFFQQLKGFDATITNGAGEDTDLWIRAALASPMVFSTQISARHNLDGSNRISHTPTKNRVFFNPDKYEEVARENLYLKKYLDINRYSFAIQHKLAKDLDSFHEYVRKIDINNLNSKQRFLLKQPRSVLMLFIRIKVMFESFGTRLTAYKS